MNSPHRSKPRITADRSVFALVVLALILASLFHSCGLT